MFFLLGDFFLLIGIVLAIRTKRMGFGGVSFAKDDNPFAFYIYLMNCIIFFGCFFYLALKDFGFV